jgi:hypothetical protein
MTTARHPFSGRFHNPAKPAPAGSTRPASAPLRSPSIVGAYQKPASVHPNPNAPRQPSVAAKP